MTSTVVVFDTVVFVRALLNPHGMWGELVFTYANAYRLVMSRRTIRELVAVLARPELRKRFTRMGAVNVATLVSLIGQAEVVEVKIVRQVSRDPKDNPFLALARAAGADYLVTADEDLLVLHSYQGTQIITGPEFRTILKEQGYK